jgi:hypothetical protein
MKINPSLLLALIFSGQNIYSQNTLDNAGLTSATPSSVAFSLRKLSTTYGGNAIKVRRSSDNAEGTVAFDAVGSVSATSVISLTPGATVGAALGTTQSGTISSSVSKTGTVSIAVNKIGTITTLVTSAAVTGLGTSFTTDLVVGDQLFNPANNTFLGVVLSITSNTVLTLNNFATVSYAAINYKTTIAKVTGTGTNFTGEISTGDLIFNSANTYLGAVIGIASATSMTLNAIDAIAVSSVVFKGSSATITGVGTSFTSLSPGNLLISNNITLGIISSINSATSITLASKAGGCVSSLAFKSATGIMAFASFYAATSVFVNTWYDQSGNGRNAVQFKSGNQPLIVNAGTLYSVGGKTSMQFSVALASFLQTTSVASYLNNTPYTLNKVTAEATINPANQFPLTTTGGGGPTNTVSHFGYRIASLLTLAQLSHDQTFNSAAGTSLECHTAVKPTALSSQFFKNGVSLGIASNGVPSYLMNVGLLNIGSFLPTNTYYNGSISELIAFPMALGTTDVTSLDANQILYYSITTSFWTGAVSTDWNNTGNWSTAVVPTLSVPAIVWIPTGKPFYPVIGVSTVQANSISVDAGASLTVNGTGVLQLAGVINNLGTCTASSGSITYMGSAPQSIASGTFTGNTVYNLTINNSTGVTMNNDLTVAGNLTFTLGKLSISTFILTLKGTVTNTVAGGITALSGSSLVINGTVSPNLSFDQTTVGTTNLLRNLTINSAGQIVTLTNNVILLSSGTMTFTAGKLAIGSTTLTLRSLIVNTVSGGLNGSAASNIIMDGTVSQTLSFDQTTPGTTNELAGLTLNCAGQTVSLSSPLVIGNSLTITLGTLADAGNQIVSSGTMNLIGGTFKLGSATVATAWPLFSVNNMSTAGTAEYTAGVSQTVSATPAYQNLTISALGGTTASNDLNVNNVLNLSAANPSTSSGSLSMATYTLNMGALATTIGIGDVTGIVKRTTILPNVTYTMGNTYSSIIFPNVGILPTQMSMKIILGAAPSWKPAAILRIYDFIQTGGSGTKAVISAHYLDGELNGNTENNLVDFSYILVPGILTENGKSNSNSVQNWVVLSNVNVAFFSSAFGNILLTLANSALTTLTWNGSTSTSWITSTNWTPNGGPSTNTILIVPDAATTPNSPSMPATASNGSLTIQAGGIVNSDPGAQLILNNSGLAWSNNGTFNAGTSTIFFSNANATMNGITNFNNVTINAGAALLMSTNNIMRIAGIMTNNGTWSTDLLTNTVEYNGSSQTILIPNGSTGSYYNLIVSGGGTNALPSASLNILGDLTINASISTTGNTIAMNGSVPQNMNAIAPLVLNNLSINNNSGWVSLNQNLNVISTITFTAGKLSIGANTLTLSGNVVNTALNGLTGGLASNLVLNGSVSLAISFDMSSVGVSNALNNLTINSAGQTISLNSDLEVNGNLLFSAGILAINANTLNLKNNLTNTAAGGLRGSSSSNLIVSGGLASPSLSFDQTTPGATNLLNNLTIFSDGQIASLSTPILIGGSLNLNDGLIQTTAANSLTLTSTAVFTGGSNLSFVSGPLTRNTNTVSDYIYPVGKPGQYGQITISPSSTAAGAYIAEYFPVTAPAGILAIALTGLSTDEYWNISRTIGPDAYVTLSYLDDNTWTPGSPDALDLIVVAELNTGIWTPQAGDVIPGNTGSGITPIKSKLQTSFSSYTFGFGQSASLPLTLLSFTGKRVDPVVDLIWITTAEYNVSQYEIERSVNGMHFSNLASINASNAPGNNTYHWTDPLPSISFNYYRLKMVDINGVFTYSNIVQISPQNDEGSITIYPNPVTGQTIHFLLNENENGLYHINIYNTLGQCVFATQIMNDGSGTAKTIFLNNNVQGGIYYFELISPRAERKIFKLFVD